MEFAINTMFVLGFISIIWFLSGLLGNIIEWVFPSPPEYHTHASPNGEIVHTHDFPPGTNLHTHDMAGNFIPLSGGEVPTTEGIVTLLAEPRNISVLKFR